MSDSLCDSCNSLFLLSCFLKSNLLTYFVFSILINSLSVSLSLSSLAQTHTHTHSLSLSTIILYHPPVTISQNKNPKTPSWKAEIEIHRPENWVFQLFFSFFFSSLSFTFVYGFLHSHLLVHMRVRHHSRMHVPTTRRLLWVTLSRLITFIFPDFILHYVFNLNSHGKVQCIPSSHSSTNPSSKLYDEPGVKR
jgi:hypothetical protein